MLDMFRFPDELKEACERLVPSMVKCAVGACTASGQIMPFIPLHKGADGFMSQEQFATFYWPSLRKLIIGLVNEGLVPQLFAEGAYNDRLEAISDVPKGKVVWWFDRTDMKRAKQTVGRWPAWLEMSLWISCAPGRLRRSKCTARTSSTQQEWVGDSSSPLERAYRAPETKT